MKLSCLEIAIGPGGLGLESRVGQIGHSVANAVTFLRSCVARRYAAEIDPATRDMLPCNNAIIMKIFE